MISEDAHEGFQVAKVAGLEPLRTIMQSFQIDSLQILKPRKCGDVAIQCELTCTRFSSLLTPPSDSALRNEYR